MALKLTHLLGELFQQLKIGNIKTRNQDMWQNTANYPRSRPGRAVWASMRGVDGVTDALGTEAHALLL